MNSEEFFPLDYIVYRKDRYNHVTTRKGGGVLIAVKNSIPNEMVASHQVHDVIAVRFKLSDSSILAVVVYVTCGSSLDTYIEIINFIDFAIVPFVHPDEQLMIFGDFNLPEVNWSNINGIFTPSSTDIRGITTVDYFASISTTQINRTSNTQGKYLDLIFATDNMYSEVSPCEDFTGCTSVYHTPVMLNIFHEKCDTYFPIDNFFFDFRNADYASLNEFLFNSDWEFLQFGGNLNTIVLSFNKLVKTGVEKHISRKKTKPGFREPWYNKQLKNIETRRNKLHSLYKIHGSEYYHEFETARKEFKTLNWFLYNNYILQIEEDLTSTPKKFWNFINMKRKSVGFPLPMTYLDASASHSSEVCNLFANFFESVYESPSIDPAVISCNGGEFTQLRFTEDDVHVSLSQIDVNKGAGYDGLPPILIKNCAASLAAPISFIFNESIRTQIFPDPWKISYIHPIFKCGKRSDICNYRGIAILSAIPKLFELMVQRFLFFQVKTVISPAQHGFFAGRSTVTNLMTFCRHLFSSIDSKVQLDVIYTDFSKAFDKINHLILIKKLQRLNCQAIPTKWLLSYLSDRWQFVKIGESSSRLFRVTSGVPQGSHIGPLLFSIFVNDVVNCFVSADCLLYADDMKIFARISNVSDCINFQADLNRFCDWSVENKLLLNVSKCKAMSFWRTRFPIIHQYSLYNEEVVRVKFISDLGVIFTRDLTFTRHIDSIISRAYMMLGFIKRNCKDFCDPLTLKSLFVSFVRSILEYASQIWSPSYRCHSERIESVQKQFLIYALKGLPSMRAHEHVLPPYRDRCALLGLQRLDHRRDISSAIFVRDVLCSRLDCAEILTSFGFYVPERCLRRRDEFIFTRAVATNYCSSEPVLNLSRVFNLVFHRFDFNMSRNSLRNELFKFFNNRSYN